MFIILLPFFFMYVFPLFFLSEPGSRTTPVFATILLAFGTVLWLLQSLKIGSFITRPRKLARKHRRVRESGRQVEARILAHEQVGETQGMPELQLLLSFLNLVGSQVRARLTIVDSRAHERRFEQGKHVDLRLNQNGFEPAFTGAAAICERKSRLWAWFWLVFNIAYATGLFLASYRLHSNGYGWRFLHPFSPWIMAPAIGVFMLGFFSRMIKSAEDVIHPGYSLGPVNSKADFGELLLYGVTARGEILNYSQTGTYIIEQPEIRFEISIHQDYGETERRSFRQVVQLTDMHRLTRGEVEVLYLPHKKGVFMLDYLRAAESQ
ncbi:MAG: hypothetical protein QM270_08370 [Bacillota bacterium]|nr:hypothetical protein [Bacillota bacterium]